MMYEIVKEFPDEIIFQKEGPCVSLYQPTHRNVAENPKDLITYKNLIRDIENSLSQKYGKADIDVLMKPLNDLKEDHGFWNSTLDGLCVLANANKCVIYVLARPVEEVAIVANSFYIKPLIMAFQSADSYNLLGITATNFSLYQANQYGVEEILIPEGVPRTKKEVLGSEHTEAYLTHGSYAGEGGNAMFHGHGGKKDEAAIDLEKYFRYVDKYVLENVSQKTKLPLILISLAENVGEFTKISNNPFLTKNSVKTSFDPLKLSKQNEEAWEIMAPTLQEKMDKLAELFKNAQANSLGTDNLKEVGEAAVAKRIKTILVEAGKMIPGRLDHATGEIEFGEIDDPECGDVFDELVIAVLEENGEVVVLEKDKMPTDTGIAAIYRF